MNQNGTYQNDQKDIKVHYRMPYRLVIEKLYTRQPMSKARVKRKRINTGRVNFGGMITTFLSDPRTIKYRR